MCVHADILRRASGFRARDYPITLNKSIGRLLPLA
jgi:hypothetical protein